MLDRQRSVVEKESVRNSGSNLFVKSVYMVGVCLSARTTARPECVHSPDHYSLKGNYDEELRTHTQQPTRSGLPRSSTG